MFNIKRELLTFSLALLTAVFLGCGSGTSTEGVPADPGALHDDHDDHDHDAHGHESGPHGGHIIELGRKHEYHAELVEHDDEHSISVYILDGDLKDLAIADETITLTLTHDGESHTFELAGEATDGGFSHFQSADEQLFELFESGEAEGKLRLNIDGKPFAGLIEHHAHDH